MDKTERRIANLQEMLDTPEWETAKSEMKLPIPLGIDTNGVKRYADLTQVQHLLIGGATKQGKTTFLRNIISVLKSCNAHDNLQFYLLDNKACEFKEYESDHKVVYGKDCEKELNRIIEEMNSRYAERSHHPTSSFSYQVVIIDEYSDFSYSNDFKVIQNTIINLAQKGPAVGIHLILATQRATPKIISKSLKACFTTSIAFRVATPQESKLLIGTHSAEQLTSAGKFLFKTPTELINVQSN